jgi:hypothetical protein
VIELRTGIERGALRNELRTRIEWQKASELTGDIADRLAEALLTEVTADGAAKLSAELPQQVADGSLRSKLRTGIERKETPELTRHSANGLAETLITERSANRAAEWSAELSQEIADSTLRHHLRTGVERQEASELTGGIADGLSETLITKRAANGAAEWRTDLSQQVADEALRGHLRTGVERQEASELTGGIADGLSETLITERAADGAAERCADLPQEVTDEALGHHLRTGVEWQELSELTGHSADRLSETLLTERAANDAAERRTELSQEVADSTLRHHLRAGIERQEATELTGHSANGLAETLIAECTANGAAEWRTKLSQEVADSALRHHLRTRIERQEASELAGNVADRLAEALLTERATNGAAERSAELSQEVANSTLRGQLLPCEEAEWHRGLRCSVHLRVHVFFLLVTVISHAAIASSATNGSIAVRGDHRCGTLRKGMDHSIYRRHMRRRRARNCSCATSVT